MKLRVRYKDGRHTDALLQGQALEKLREALAAIGVTDLTTIQALEVTPGSFIPLTESRGSVPSR